MNNLRQAWVAEIESLDLYRHRLSNWGETRERDEEE